MGPQKTARSSFERSYRLQHILSFFSFVDRIFARCVEILIVTILLVMVALVASQVVLRDLMNGGILWADVASRHMVLWIAFLGAMLATRSREHLAIDAFSKFIPRKPRNILRIGLDALACFVSALLAKASFAFVLSEKSMGSELFIGIPAWVAQTIIPFGFAMIAVEYAIGIGLDIYRIARDGSKHEAGRGRA